MPGFEEWVHRSEEKAEWCEISTGCGVWVVKRPILAGIGLSVCNKTSSAVDVELEFGQSRNACVEVRGGGNRLRALLGPGESRDAAVFAALDAHTAITCTYKASCNILSADASARGTPPATRTPTRSGWGDQQQVSPSQPPSFAAFVAGGCGGGSPRPDNSWALNSWLTSSGQQRSPDRTSAAAAAAAAVAAASPPRSRSAAKKKKARASSPRQRQQRSQPREGAAAQPPPPALLASPEERLQSVPRRRAIRESVRMDEVRLDTPHVQDAPGPFPSPLRKWSTRSSISQGVASEPESPVSPAARSDLSVDFSSVQKTMPVAGADPPVPATSPAAASHALVAPTYPSRPPSLGASSFRGSMTSLNAFRAPQPPPPSSPPPPAEPRMAPPKPPDRTELMRTPIEPHGAGHKVVCVVEKLGEAAIGFEIHNNSGQDGQVTIDFTNAKNCKIVALGDNFEGEAVTGSVLKGGIRSLAVCMKKRQGTWDYCHALSWIPYTGRTAVQNHHLAPGVTLNKHPQADSTWQFGVKNNTASDVQVTINFDGSSNLSVLPIGQAVFSDVQKKGYQLCVSSTARGGGADTRLCSVGPRNSMLGWSWAYKVSHYVDRKGEREDDKRPLPLSTHTYKVSGAELCFTTFDENQTHIMLCNRQSHPMHVVITFACNDQCTFLPCQMVRKESSLTYSMALPAFTKLPFVVAVFSSKDAPVPTVADVIVQEIKASDFNKAKKDAAT